MPKLEDDLGGVGESSSSSRRSARSHREDKRNSSGSKGALNSSSKSGDGSSSGQEVRQEGLLARLQTPDALQYMQYFVIFNSLFILFVMAWPQIIQALNGYSHHQQQHPKP